MVIREFKHKGECITVIWVVSKSVCNSFEELNSRHKYIKEVTKAEVTPWSESSCEYKWLGIKRTCSFYVCKSKKGEYGIIITAHIPEIVAIFKNLASSKRAIIVVNSCEINKGVSSQFLSIVKQKNIYSELFYAHQEKHPNGSLVNYADDVGDFGFRTTLSERMLFRHRNEGIIKAIRGSFQKVVA